MTRDITKPDQVTALVIDDDPSSLTTKVKLLEANGFVVEGVTNIEDAVRQFKTVSVDIVVTDINLSGHGLVDKAGVDFARVIRTLDSDVPIIGYSAAFSEGDLTPEEWGAFDRYLAKGWANPSEILRYVIDWKSMATRYRRQRSVLRYDHLELLRASNEQPVLYSVNTRLAYNIAEGFFGKEHYVWCTPEFDSRSKPSYIFTVPPSSCPKDIYHLLAKAVEGGDRGSDKIRINRRRILAGASFRKAAGEITEAQYNEIKVLVRRAQIADFRPLLYIIPRALVAHLLKKAPIEKTAATMSPEFIIERLPRSYFDVVELQYTSW